MGIFAVFTASQLVLLRSLNSGRHARCISGEMTQHTTPAVKDLLYKATEIITVHVVRKVVAELLTVCPVTPKEETPTSTSTSTLPPQLLYTAPSVFVLVILDYNNNVDIQN